MSQRDVQQVLPMVMVYVVIFFGAIALTLFGFSSRNPFMVGALAAIPFALLLLNRLDIWLMTILLFLNSSMRPPGLFGKLELFQMLLLGLLAVLMAKKIIVKTDFRREGAQWWLLFLFMFIMLITVAIRGAGFRFLGDERWGGMRYIGLLLTLAFPFFVGLVVLSPKQWKWALAGMGLLSTLGFVADMVFILTHGKVYQLYYFFQHGGGVAMSLQAAEHGQMTRFQAAGVAAMGFMLIPMVLFEARAKNLWKFVPFVAVALILVGLSGHRLALFNLLVFAWCYAFYNLKGHRTGLVIASALAGILMVALAAVFARSLPLSFQRTLAFLPFVQIDPQAALDAAATSEWRFTVWKNAIYEIPDYLWIGKGYTYDQAVADALSLLPNAERILEWPRVVVAYHNGPLSLLIGMGIPGLVVGIAFLLASLSRHLRLMSRGVWNDPVLHRLHSVIGVLYFLQVIKFIFLYGDVYVSFPPVFMQLGIMEGLWFTNRAMGASSSPPEGPLKPKKAHPKGLPRARIEPSPLLEPSRAR